MRSGLGVTVVMLARKLTLDDNTTCQIWKQHKNINFYSVDVERLSIGSPLGTIFIQCADP